MQSGVSAFWNEIQFLHLGHVIRNQKEGLEELVVYRIEEKSRGSRQRQHYLQSLRPQVSGDGIISKGKPIQYNLIWNNIEILRHVRL